MPETSPSPSRVVLFTRTGCHLCEGARDLVRRVCDPTGVAWVEVDVDAPGPDGGALREEYGELVPVVEVDGVRQGYWYLDEERLRRAVAARPPRS